MKDARAAYLRAYARRLIAQADASTGKLVSVQKLEQAFLVADTIVRGAPDTIAGRAKKRRDPGRHALVNLAKSVYQWMAQADWIIADARRELEAELKRRQGERDA